MNSILDTLIQNYCRAGYPDQDLAGKSRIEIPAGFLLAITQQTPETAAITHPDLIAKLVQTQTPAGYWMEKPYPALDEDIGHYGAIPTAFCLIALAHIYSLTANEPNDTDTHDHLAMLSVLVKGADYLLTQETCGRFRKSAINKSDVLNTNLMAALALVRVAEGLHPGAQRTAIYKEAAQRAVIHSIKSQFYNGGFPYTTDAWHIPYLYHTMTLALLIILYRHFPDAALMRKAIQNGIRYWELMIIDPKTGEIKWHLERHPEKSGASWAYGWSLVVAKALGNETLSTNILNHLHTLYIPFQYLRNDTTEPSDLFYSSWTMLALALAQPQDPLVFPFGELTSWTWEVMKSAIRRQRRKLKYAGNRFYETINGIHNGPIEYW